MRSTLGILLLASLLSLTSLGPAAVGDVASAAPANQATTALGWASLGPPGPEAIRAVAVPPTWPRDRLLLAVRGSSLVTSPDGGQRWTQATLPTERVVALAQAPSPQGIPVAFLLAEDGLHRSADAGATWQLVRSFASGGQPPLLALSPDFARDGLALLVAEGRLLRGEDSGATWTPVELAEGQGVRQVRFSPDYARDRTIFLAVTTAGFPSLTVDGSRDAASDDHLRSLGVVVSVDAGATWTVHTNGLAVEGVPYHHVQQLAVSPTYSTDGTLFAFAWGPREPAPFMGGTARQLQAALFRSRDRAATWEPVRTLVPAFTRTTALLALSPRFASDGVALMADNTGGASPASTGCSLLRSGDGGTAWQTVRDRGSYEACGSLWLLNGAAAPVAIAQKGPGWLQSPDGGQTWQTFAPPEGNLGGASSAVTPVQSAAPALPVFAGATFGGVWSFGLDQRATNGRLPCSASAEGGFGRVWRGEAWARARLGCPLAPEQPVAIRLRAYDREIGNQREPVRGIWVDDASADWYELAASTWLDRPKAGQPWPSADATIRGAAQPYAGGQMLWLPYPDGRRAILVLAQPDNQWREYPD